MIRPAILADVDAIFTIAVYEAEQYERLRIDGKKIRNGITQAISSARHFAWVSVDKHNYPVGALIGLTSDNLWAQRRNCFVALWQADIPGEGRKLLKEFKAWVSSRRAIRVAGFVPDSEHCDWRAYALANRMGFKRNGGTFLIFN